jgi:hypothetical protein
MLYYFTGAKLSLLVLDTGETVLHNILCAELFFQPQRINHREQRGEGGSQSLNHTTDIIYGDIIIIIVIIIYRRPSYLVMMVIIITTV